MDKEPDLTAKDQAQPVGVPEHKGFNGKAKRFRSPFNFKRKRR